MSGQGRKLSGNDADIERMLREALRVLCSSTVAYTTQLSIDAMVSITVDNAEIIFVNIHENIDSDTPVEIRSSSLEKSSGCDASTDSVADTKDIISHNQQSLSCSRQATDELNSSISTLSSEAMKSIPNQYVSPARASPLDHLQWNTIPDKKARNSKVWEFMGELTVFDSVSGCSYTIDDQLYCKLCLDEQKLDGNGNISKVYCAKRSTASGNHLLHASSKHKKQFPRDKPQSQPTPVVTKNNDRVQPQPYSQHEFNRDLAVYMARDLVPLHAFAKPGFLTFCEKNTPFIPPSPEAICAMALIDVYSAVKDRVKTILASCYGGTLMMETWTDKCRRMSHFIIRLSVVHEWQFKVLTLSTQPVETYSYQALGMLVKNTLDDFLPNHRQNMLFNTTNCDANLKSLSTLLGHERIDCVAHCLHLLLIADGIGKVPELVLLLQKCKVVVSAVHANGHILTSASDMVKDMEVFERLQSVIKALASDDANPVTDDADSEQPLTGIIETDNCSGRFITNGVCSRWTCTLAMVESMLDLHKQLKEALRKIGKLDLFLRAEEIGVLLELRRFLSHLKSMNLLATECNPNLSFLPLLRTRILKACEPLRDGDGQPIDSRIILRLKELVRASLDRRIKINHLVKVASCFDPGVRNVLLTNDECVQLLRGAYDKLTKDGCKYQVPGLVRHVPVYIKTEPSTSVSEWKCQPSDECGEMPAKKLRLSLLLETATTSSNRSGDIFEPFIIEINRYLSFSVSDDVTALEFWKRNEADFPILSKMAKIYLSMSPGCVPVECLFSTAGKQLSTRGTSLAPYKVGLLTFVHDNYDVCYKSNELT